MSGKLLRCIKCGEIVNPIEGLDDKDFFKKRHGGHRIEKLFVKEGSYVSDEAFGRPVRESYFEATNGKKIFVIKRTMKNVENEAEYTIIPGRINIKKIGIELRVKEIKQQIRMDRNLKKISGIKIDKFINSIEKLVSHLNPSEVEEMPWASDYPMLGIGKLKDDKIEEIIRMVNKEFNGNEREKIKDFIINQTDGDGVMTLNIIKCFQINNER
ncbi:MAG: hypothetical protein A2W05_08025 [Candidatus Schekmanbacteria bacterium RBG_16_38_10]|uniref:Uncharacterized protein n=1 Tax=Candidatus Schekmanbacteria bacterium RBG_16_38_10 TaxID=1817879 RepID=A0A1F7RSD3_9BACT|nr:MAG: hypothetical protein A2W05_08025 [Candidatus Schekmanbacteria bacterium RBG_16_38_10]